MSETHTLAATTAEICVHTPGVFVWHELATKDPVKAQKFYGDLLGWTIKTVEMPGMEYHLIHVGDKQIGGMREEQNDAIPPHWLSYVSVPDVDAAAATAKTAGGQVMAGPMDIPNIGRFAVVIDPQGAAVALYKDAKGDPDTTGEPALGEFVWDQLNTTDIAAGAAFYEKVVGWTSVTHGPDGGMFKYGDLHEASFMTAPAGVPSHWLTYLSVADLGAATQKAESLGAKILMANMDAGEFGRFTVIQDPIGAFVALFQGHDH